MDGRTFNQVIDEQLQVCTNILVDKADEYASDVDRLHNFKVAAGLEGTTVRRALGGMMAKHTVSVYDLIRDGQDDTPMELWNEKITDHINYLLLLKALVAEEHMNGEPKC